MLTDYYSEVSVKAILCDFTVISRRTNLFYLDYADDSQVHPNNFININIVDY